jgi:hypothetical protein
MRYSCFVIDIRFVTNEQFDAVAAANSQAPLQFASFNLRLIHELKPVWPKSDGGFAAHPF